MVSCWQYPFRIRDLWCINCGSNQCTKRAPTQRKRTPKGLTAAARKAVDDHYGNPRSDLCSLHPEIAEHLDVLERYWISTQDLPVRKAAKAVGKELTTIHEWGTRLEETSPPTSQSTRHGRTTCGRGRSARPIWSH